MWETKKGLRRDKRKTLAHPSLTLNIFQRFIVSKGYRILHSRIVVWCVEHYFVDLDQTQIHTKDKSVRFCFKLLFFCAKKQQTYTTINFVNLWSQTSHISSGIMWIGTSTKIIRWYRISCLLLRCTSIIFRSRGELRGTVGCVCRYMMYRVCLFMWIMFMKNVCNF